METRLEQISLVKASEFEIKTDLTKSPAWPKLLEQTRFAVSLPDYPLVRVKDFLNFGWELISYNRKFKLRKGF